MPVRKAVAKINEVLPPGQVPGDHVRRIGVNAQSLNGEGKAQAGGDEKKQHNEPGAGSAKLDPPRKHAGNPGAQVGLTTGTPFTARVATSSSMARRARPYRIVILAIEGQADGHAISAGSLWSNSRPRSSVRAVT